MELNRKTISGSDVPPPPVRQIVMLSSANEPLWPPERRDAERAEHTLGEGRVISFRRPTEGRGSPRPRVPRRRPHGRFSNYAFQIVFSQMSDALASLPRDPHPLLLRRRLAARAGALAAGCCT